MTSPRVARTWFRGLLAGWLVAAWSIGSGSTAPAAGGIDFASEVAPVLEAHCVRCHAPGNEQGEVSLATAADLEEFGYLNPGDPEASYLIELVTSADGEPPRMPAEGEPLSREEVELLRRWIADGASWPEEVVVRQRSKADATWWSLQPLADVRPPTVKGLPKGWGDNPIDRFIFAELAEEGLRPNRPADRPTLIRRATYDLIGLPPAPEEIDDFVSDRRPDAYERLVDRLLDSPRYGERWARHWLDVVRFGESNGFERNVIINTLWPFRDYVIRSLNEDKPFDRFIREHVAGDVLGGDDPQVAVGSAFLVAGPYDDVKNQDPAQAAQIRANTLDEIISATGQAFLGMTIGCARCHDHKFDPISQRDYYRWYATFAGVRHGEVPLATAREKAERAERLRPLRQREAKLQAAVQRLRDDVLERARCRLDEYRNQWTRPPVDRTETEEAFAPVTAKYVRLVCEAQDIRAESASGFRIDEFEIWSAEPSPRNVALASSGARASGRARQIEDFPGAYGPQLAIDGKAGARFIATGNDLTIELAEPTPIDRVVFSSARGEVTPEHPKFVFVAEYRIEVSEDGKSWQEVASGRDRRPVDRPGHLERRLLELEITPEERAEQRKLQRELASVRREIAAVPDLPTVWIGKRVDEDAAGPFHVFLGGSPQKLGEEVTPASLSALQEVARSYRLSAGDDEASRRMALAEWITDSSNPLTPRVLANRVWHYHFGTGIVATPSDFGYMGGEPSHPELLDFLARYLLRHDWRLKPLHRLIMTSQAYRQSSRYRAEAARVDGDARKLWRFPPRRLSAEEIRDTMLQVAGVLDGRMGGPGFRLYHFMQDNVCTYVPLDEHGPETYRRAVYHQNARASVVDLMTDFDQPDCAFSTPRRAETTTPLQALTMLNHDFTVDMAEAMAKRLRREAGEDPKAQIERAFRLLYGRAPSRPEVDQCREIAERHGLESLARVLLNTSEMIDVR